MEDAPAEPERTSLSMGGHGVGEEVAGTAETLPPGWQRRCLEEPAVHLGSVSSWSIK